MTRLLVTIIFAVVFVLSMPVAADVKLPAVLGDNMVLQQNVPLKIWGWATAGEKVSVKLADQTRSTLADKNGDWMVAFDPLKTGEPIEMTVTGKNTLTLRNILVGEVWVCSGQSNMALQVTEANDAAKEITQSEYPQIRLFNAYSAPSATVVSDVKGSWVPCGPRTVPNFSAVGYYFGRQLHKNLKMPVGLINASVGNTAAEPWISRESLMAIPQLKSLMERYAAAVRDPAGVKAAFEKAMPAWEDKAIHKDPGNKGFAMGFAAAETSDADWKDMRLPHEWQATGMKFNGAVWFRKTIDLPASMAGKDLLLNLDKVDDYDTTYFNGQKVGGIGLETPNPFFVSRSYKVPASLVKPGRNVIAVRVFDRIGGGGFTGRAAKMNLVPAAPEGQDALPLAGSWKYKVELELPQHDFADAPPYPLYAGTSAAPSNLYNGLIAPLTRFAIRGAIWYQGEANIGRAISYRTVFPALIKDWRAAWNESDMPFLFVQLTNCHSSADQPDDSPMAELREAQLMTLSVPKTGMAVAIDIGDSEDIHAGNKQDVGKRLELAALAQAYGKDVVYSGPIYKSMKIEGDFSPQEGQALTRPSGLGKPLTANASKRVRLSFDHVDGGLVVKGDKLNGFAIAGEDRKFVWADAIVDGDTVVVSSKQVPHPKAVRYAWANNPVCNLYNKANLPASPFRTDDWPITSSDK
jgi:sialate O-acetylesterase